MNNNNSPNTTGSPPCDVQDSLNTAIPTNNVDESSITETPAINASVHGLSFATTSIIDSPVYELSTTTIPVSDVYVYGSSRADSVSNNVYVSSSTLAGISSRDLYESTATGTPSTGAYSNTTVLPTNANNVYGLPSTGNPWSPVMPSSRPRTVRVQYSEGELSEKLVSYKRSYSSYKGHLTRIYKELT